MNNSSEFHIKIGKTKVMVNDQHNKNIFIYRPAFFNIPAQVH